MHEFIAFVVMWLLTHIVGLRTLNRLLRRMLPEGGGDEPPDHGPQRQEG